MFKSKRSDRSYTNFGGGKNRKFARMPTKPANVDRRAHGVCLATADLVIMLPMITLGCLLIIDSALGGYYKQRLGMITDQAARYAANIPGNTDPVEPTKKLVKNLLRQNALKGKDIKVKVEQVRVEDAEAISVTTTLSVPLLEGTMLPVSITISDTSVSLVPANKVMALVAISPSSYAQSYPQRNLSLFLPIVKPRADLPVWSFPYDTAIGSLSLQGGSPPIVPIQPPASAEGLQQRESLY